MGEGLSGGGRGGDIDGALPAEDREVFQYGLTGRLGVFDYMTRFLSGIQRRKTVHHQHTFLPHRFIPRSSDCLPSRAQAKCEESHVCSTKTLISPYPFLASLPNITPRLTFSSSKYGGSSSSICSGVGVGYVNHGSGPSWGFAGLGWEPEAWDWGADGVMPVGL